MQHRLVILGSLYENVSLVLEAKKRGIYTIVCDGYRNGHAKTLADKYYDIDIRDTDALAKMCIDERADGIVGSFSDLVFEKVTETAAKAGLKWYVAPDKLRYYRDKKQAKDLLQSLGINVPKSMLTDAENIDSGIGKFSFPVVVKPVSGWGSRGIFVAEDADELKELAPKTALISGSSTVLVEEYSKSGEYNITAFLTNGKVNIIGSGDREKSPSGDKTVPRLTRIYYRKDKNKKLIAAAQDVLQRFADATGQKNGVLSMQCFFDGEKLMVGEITGRILAYEHDIIEQSAGSYIPGMLIDCVYDEPGLRKKIKEISVSCPERIYARLYFFAENGSVIGNMDRVIELCRHEAVTDDLIFYNEGDTVDNSGTKSYFATFSLSVGDLEELDRITKYFYEHMKVYSPDGRNIIYPCVFDSIKYTDDKRRENI